MPERAAYAATVDGVWEKGKERVRPNHALEDAAVERRHLGSIASSPEDVSPRALNGTIPVPASASGCIACKPSATSVTAGMA